MTEEKMTMTPDQVRALVTSRFRAAQATARAKEREHLERELCAALGMDPDARSWSSLIPMVIAAISVTDAVFAHALPEVDAEQRRDLLVTFGVAEEFARVESTARRMRTGSLPPPMVGDAARAADGG